MKTVFICVLIALLPAISNAVTLGLEMESIGVPLHGAACGIPTVTNDQSVSVEVDYPSVVRQTMWFEVRTGDLSYGYYYLGI